MSSLLTSHKVIRQKSGKIDLPAYLSASSLFPKFYLKCPKTGEERAALGSLASFPENLPDDPSLCFYGALPFKEPKDDLWKDFSSPLFFLPKIEIIQKESETEIILHSLDGTYPPFPLETPIPLEGSYELSHKKSTHEKKHWYDSIEKALRKIEEGCVDKVVLARKSEFNLSTKNPFNVLQKLLKRCPSTSTFAIGVDPSSLFLGSTPEKLFERKGRTLFSEAIAGTRKRGKTPAEDAALAKELQGSKKDREEVLFVKEFLSKRLKPFSKAPPSTEEASLIKTDTVQHLRFPFKTILKDEVSDKELIEALHPTPAVGGVPKKESQEIIQEVENFERGLYAGVTGWISPNSTTLYVAIRSALIKENTLHAFAGAGIVKGSKKDKEWEELNHKISHWVNT